MDFNKIKSTRSKNRARVQRKPATRRARRSRSQDRTRLSATPPAKCGVEVLGQAARSFGSGLSFSGVGFWGLGWVGFGFGGGNAAARIRMWLCPSLLVLTNGRQATARCWRMHAGRHQSTTFLLGGHWQAGTAAAVSK